MIRKLFLLSLYTLLIFVFEKNNCQSVVRVDNDCRQNGCCDNNKHCVTWSLLGECTKSPKFMLANCKKSCNACGSNGSINSFPRFSNDNLSGCPLIQTSQLSTDFELSEPIFRSFLKQRQCGVETSIKDCSKSICYHKFFRTPDGSCNNIENPTWGAAKTRYLRLLPSFYEDGISIPIGMKTIFRPHPRTVTRHLLNSDKNIFSNFNQLAMQWGQFISHDILFNGRSDFCTCQTFSNTNCMNVNTAKDDISKLMRKVMCTPITRSIPVCRNDDLTSPREQMNLNTGFLDGSTIYGSTTETMNNLRNGHLLKFEKSASGSEFAPEALSMLGSSMKLGDERGLIFVGIASLHTIFLRYHNIIARELKTINSHWSDDRIFQETRKIVGGAIQSITYNEFLPALLGSDNLDFLISKYIAYDDSVSPAISNEFSAAAFRLHGMVVKNYPFINDNYKVLGNIKFVQGTNTFLPILQRSISQLMRGLIATPLRKPQRLTSQVTEELFDGIFDMATINIQRGRDHGLRAYNDYRIYCGLKPIKNFSDWEDVSDADVKLRAQQLYRTPDNMELYVGGLLEEPIKGGVVGPTFACIIADQFKRLRDGDRFFYQNNEVFTNLQSKEINSISIASVICSSEPDIKNVPVNAFDADKGENAVPCSMIPFLNLSLWRSNN